MSLRSIVIYMILCKFFTAEVSKLDKNDNVEDERNNEISLPLEMEGEEIIFKTQRKKKSKSKKKRKHKYGKTESSDSLHSGNS